MVGDDPEAVAVEIGTGFDTGTAIGAGTAVDGKVRAAAIATLPAVAAATAGRAARWSPEAMTVVPRRPTIPMAPATNIQRRGDVGTPAGTLNVSYVSALAGGDAGGRDL